MSHNDFTLEELVLIQDNLYGKPCPDILHKLLKLNQKLKAMIADYCEHDFQNTYSEMEVWECSKCGIEG